MESGSDSAKHLPVHEWLAIASILLMLGTLTTIILLSGDPEIPSQLGTPQYTVAQEIEVFVKGAVENPRKLYLKRGAVLRDLLDQIVLLPEADLRRLNLDRKLRNGSVVKIPVRKTKRKTAKKSSQ